MYVDAGIVTPSVPGARHDEVERLASVVVRLGRMFRQLAKGQQAVGGRGPEKAAYLLLAGLVVEGPLPLSRLAELAYCDRSTVSRQVTQLVDAGLVERHADPEDGRVSLLVPTEAGNALLDEHHRTRTANFADMLADWPDDELHEFVMLFERFAAAVERHAGRKGTS